MNSSLEARAGVVRKVLLVYPGLVDGFNSYIRGVDWFNHGVGIISAVLKRKGHAIEYVDCRRLKGWADLRKRIGPADFDVALLSVATVDFAVSVRIAGIIKEANPSCKVIVGGPHPTLVTEQTANVREFDHVFTHEAEMTLPEVLDRLDSAPRVIRGEMPPDLDALPFVDRTLAPDGERSWFEGLERRYFSITASRGCLYRCAFCQPAERYLFGDKVRRRSVGNILDELEQLAKVYRMRSFMIHDDCFTQYPPWVEAFCEEKLRRGLDQPFACQTRADILCKRPGLLSTMRDAGLRWVLIGFESGSDRVLAYLKKETTVAQNLEAADLCRRAGVKIYANYMFGVPTESREEMRQTAAMMQAIRPDIYGPAVFTPAPGSDLYRHCEENGLILIRSSRGYRREAGSGPKIKGVDYAWVNRMVYESMRMDHRRNRYRWYINSKIMQMMARLQGT